MKILIVQDYLRSGGTERQSVFLASAFAKAGHEVKLSYSRDPVNLETSARAIGARASVGSVAEAVEFGEAVVFSVPWANIDDVLAEAGDLEGKILIDTTNQFASGGLAELPDGKTAAQLNSERMPGARYVKAFNTLTAGFQGAAAGLAGSLLGLVLRLRGDLLGLVLRL
jgi:hypothetical protein